MGLYRYITQEETDKMKSVSDPELNELLQEALQYSDTILIDEHTHYFKKWIFGKYKEEKSYTLYHESRAFDGSAYQAKYMAGMFSKKEFISAYLIGIINGGRAVEHRNSNSEGSIKK